MATTDTLLPITDGPWRGMVDSVAPTAKQPGRYLLGQNIYPLDPAIGEGVIGRPGVQQLGGIGGSAGARRVQGHYEFVKASGTKYVVRIVGGKFYTLDWGASVWTEVLTTAQLTAAAITIDPAVNQVAFLTFSDKLVVSDGVNTPWTWDGTTGAGLTKLTNCPALYGQPTIYVARILGIKASDPTVFVWSEVDLPNTGYEAGGYNNAWRITQTDPNRLYRLLGTNDYIHIFRARSSTSVGGTVTSNFSTSATRDALSETVGTVSPFAVVLQDVNAIFLDADIHPQVFRPGGIGATPLWTAFRDTLRKVPKDAARAAKAMALIYPPAQLMMFAICDVNSTEPDILLVYDVKGPDPIPVAIWHGWEMTSVAMVRNAADEPVMLHGDSSGYTYLHGNPEDNLWNDALVTGTVPIRHRLITQALGFDTKREKIFDRVDLSLRAMTRMTLRLSLLTPRGESAPQAVTVDSNFPGLDTSVLETTFQLDPDLTLVTEEAHAAVGLDDQARWAKVHIDHETLNEQFGMIALSMDAYPTNDDPEVP